MSLDWRKYTDKFTDNGILIIEDIPSLSNANFLMGNFIGNKDNIMIIDWQLVKNCLDDIIMVYYNENNIL